MQSTPLPSQKHGAIVAGPRGAATRSGPRQSRRSSTYHEVLHPIAELVNEEDGEVMHGLPQLDPGGVKQFSESLRMLSPLEEPDTAETLDVPQRNPARNSMCLWSQDPTEAEWSNQLLFPEVTAMGGKPGATEWNTTQAVRE